MSDRYNDVFPTRLRELIEKNDTTITAVAKKLGISRQAVSQYTMGQGQPNADKLLQIAEYFEVSCDWLVGRQGATKRFETDLPGVCKFLNMDEGCVKSLQGIAQIAENYPGALHWLLLNDIFEPALQSIMQYYVNMQEAKKALRENDLAKAKRIWKSAQFFDYVMVMADVRDMLRWWEDEDDTMDKEFADFVHFSVGDIEVEDDG